MIVITSAVSGAVIASFLACVPGLHVYNVMALVIIAVHAFAARGIIVSSEILLPLSAGMITGYSMLNTIPSVLLAAPDESALFTVHPGQKYLMAGRGYEGTMITASGGLAGLVLLVAVAGPLAPKLLPITQEVFRPHTHWILWCVICFMLMSEWPMQATMEWPGWTRFLKSWAALAAGLFTFLLSGLLGFILFFRSPVRAEAAFQNLMPAFIGLFTMPWLILNIISRTKAPAQTITTAGIRKDVVLKGAFSGGLGGGFAAFFPVITGGVGGFLAGHATALRDDRVFLAAQGTSKLVYYVGAFLLLFVPGLHLARGGGAWLIRSVYMPYAPRDYYMVLASIAIAGAVSFFLVSPLTRGTIRIFERHGLHRTSCLALIIILALVLATTGIAGVFVTITATGIGLVPLMFGSRRMNCLGVILLPMACNMSGFGTTIANALGLI